MLKKYVRIGAVLATGCVSSHGFAADVWSEPFRVEKIEASGLSIEFTVSNPNVSNHEQVPATCKKTKDERKFSLPKVGGNQSAYLSLLMTSLNLNNKLRLRYPKLAPFCGAGTAQVVSFDALELSL
ncbi:hypothetical protein [Oligoflexus tunisiensis]|uniref:hypothetical protein n=1 Tax=Oligoflexus tunisiensis TaxID=708132 RepID=UPI00114D2DBF|nr:hypothetical protein [Oligoflexus tunisiensis]